MGESIDNNAVNLLTQQGGVAVAVPTTGTDYSASIMLKRNRNFGLRVQFDSPGTVNVRVELEQGSARPTSEGAVDTAWDSTDILHAGITDELPHHIVVSPIVGKFARIKFVGLAGNDAGTTVSVLEWNETKSS